VITLRRDMKTLMTLSDSFDLCCLNYSQLVIRKHPT
jgi:hypothetical protein